MTENLFEIASLNRSRNNRSPQQRSNDYQILVQAFCNNSYGLYTELFIKKMIADGLEINQNLLKYNLKKNIRKCVKKFMLTDLELVFLAYYCNLNSWQIQNITNWLRELYNEEYQNTIEDQVQEKCLEMFLDLNAYFVKSYIGNIQQFQSIDSYLSDIFPQFIQIYQKWVTNKLQNKQNVYGGQNLFVITPRKINQIYRQYSRSAQIKYSSSKKDYNDLVETLVELSTAYSIIPNKKNQKQKVNKEKHIQLGKQTQVTNSNKYYNGLNKTNKQKQRRQRYNKRSQIFKIAQNSELQEQSSVPKYGFDYLNMYSNNNSNKAKRKSSLLFESLQSLSRKSQQLLAENNKFKQQNNVQQNNKTKQLQVEQPPERSRQKKQIKISLNKKRQSKPNQTVLGFLKQPSILQLDNQGSAEKNRSQKGKINNLSFLNSGYGSYKQHNNFSFLNMRSNRSSRSNSQLPFLWRPGQEDNFFQKSKLN